MANIKVKRVYNAATQEDGLRWFRDEILPALRQRVGELLYL